MTIRPWDLMRQKLNMNSDVNIVWDGNSLVYGKGSSGGQTLPVQTSALAPVAGSGAATSSFATNGHKWSDMDAGATQVDGAWVAGKTNILIFWEHINSIWVGGLTPDQSIEQMRQYIANRRALNPWIVLTLTCLPVEGYEATWSQLTRDAVNAKLDAVNAAMRSSRALMGLDALVDVRKQGSIFNISSYTTAEFDSTGAVWMEPSGTRLHLNNTGYGLIAGMVADALFSVRGVVA